MPVFFGGFFFLFHCSVRSFRVGFILVVTQSFCYQCEGLTDGLCGCRSEELKLIDNDEIKSKQTKMNFHVLV